MLISFPFITELKEAHALNLVYVRYSEVIEELNERAPLLAQMGVFQDCTFCPTTHLHYLTWNGHVRESLS